MSLERELKFPLADPQQLRGRLAALGALLEHPESFEDNSVWDRDGELYAGACLLRLRRDGQGFHLTYKGPASFEGGVKTRTEHEVGLSDPESAEQILSALGYKPVRRYQKRRETWLFEGVAVSLDQTPMGGFVEFEGDRALEVSKLCGLDAADALAGSYLSLWADFRSRHPESSEDMVFLDQQGAIEP